MEKQQKKQVKKYISWGLILALVALLAVMPLLADSGSEATGPQASVLSATAQRGDIASQLIGGGTLAGQTAVNVDIPAAVKLTGYLVENGDTVQEGDPIATVDRVTVMTAITQVQETLEYLAEQIADASGDETADTVAAQAGGTVKLLYAQEGELVQDVMLRDGALAVLSLDGLMAVRLECDTTLSATDPVLVTLSDGTQVSGQVESNLNGVLTVTVEDAGYPVGEAVSVACEDGTAIGSGTLYIHSQWNAVAYSGRVSRLRVSQGDTVTAGKSLMELSDTGYTAAYYALSDQHREYEELMLDLFRMYQTETLTAPCSGIVSGVDEDGTYMLSGEGSGWELTFLANAPNGEDETSYANYIGQVMSVGVDGLVMKMNPQQLSVTDYKDLSGVPTDTSLMTEDVIYSGQAPIYTLSGGEWVQLDAASIGAGDVLLFAADDTGNFVWVVRVAAAQEPDSTEPTQPETDPTQPSEPAQPDTPAQPEQPGDTTDATDPTTSTEPGQTVTPSLPQTGGAISGFFGGAVQEEEFELYSLDMVTVAAVTAQEEMTVEISIDELDISRLYLGQTAAVMVNALPGEQFTATVTQIGNDGQSSGGNSKFTVELTLEKTADMLPGMNVSAVITLDTFSDVVTVPVAALQDTGTQTYVYTGYDEETGEYTAQTAVTVGASDGENAQILSGIEEGTVVYYPYYDTLEISYDVESQGFSFGR